MMDSQLSASFGEAAPSLSPDGKIVAIIVQQGKLLDFIDGRTQRDETPEEYVRQEIAKSLVREYDYPKRDIAVEFTVRIGTRKPRADLGVFFEGKDHVLEQAYIIVECKAQTVKSSDRNEGVGQLQSYLTTCINSRYGMWTNGLERYCYRKVQKEGKFLYEEIPDLPSFGQTEEEAERPRFDQLKPATSDALLFAFRRCHNYIAGNQGLQKPEAFWELLKLIFCKIHDERNSTAMNYVIAKIRDSEERKGGNFDRIETAIRQRVKQFTENYIVGIDLNPNLVKASNRYLTYALSRANGLHLSARKVLPNVL